jgi:hypothetical protein
VELGRRPWRPWEVGSQTLVTALCGLAATLAWLTLGGGVVGNVDFIALATLFTAVVGASLAWYLPQAAASRRYDPTECAHRNARGCRSGPVRERGPGRPMAGATASLSRQ